MKILSFIDWYLPGYKSGGPVRSVDALVSQLPADFHFWLVTRNRDHTETRAYTSVRTNNWNNVGRAKVFYLSRHSENVFRVAHLVNEIAPDLIYANSLFSRLTIRYLLARRLGLVPRTPFLLAPRGELSPAALRIKHYKKRPFLHLAHVAGLLDDTLWQASTPLERDEMRIALGDKSVVWVSRNITVACDLTRPLQDTSTSSRPSKQPGKASFVFVSRISRKKNLLSAIHYMSQLHGDITFDIIGPVDDNAYWSKCEAAIALLPPNIRTVAHGPIAHNLIAEAFSKHDFFVFPTLGENFGHVIYESLASGCPVILSDTTPWNDFAQQGCGFNVPLSDPARWVSTLQLCVGMGEADHAAFTQNARAAALLLADRDEAIRQNVDMLNWALRTGTSPPNKATSRSKAPSQS